MIPFDIYIHIFLTYIPDILTHFDKNGDYNYEMTEMHYCVWATGIFAMITSSKLANYTFMGRRLSFISPLCYFHASGGCVSVVFTGRTLADSGILKGRQ